MKFRFAAVAVALCITGSAASAAEMTLTFATDARPGQDPHPQVSLPWVARVNAAGKGIVNIKVVQGYSLVNPRTFYARLQNDVVQIVYGLQGSVGGVFHLSDVVRIPYMVKNAETGSVAFWRLYKSGLLDTDYKDVHPLAIAMYPQGGLHLAKPPKRIDDFAGLRLVANSKMTADIIEKLGATPITILIQETYEALARHTVDGTATGYPAVAAFKFNEVAPYHLDVEVGGGATMLIMAKKKWLRLPKPVQKIHDENAGESLARAYGAENQADWVRVRSRMMKMPGQTVVVPSAAQVAMFKRKLAPVADDWVKETPGAAAVLAKFRKLLAQVGDEKK